MMNKKVISLKDNILTPNFGALKSRSYAVSVKYFDKENPSPSKRIDYQSEITINSKDDKFLLSIGKNTFWFNGHEPDLISEMIADELSKTIYPVQVEVSEAGGYQKITNFEYITKSRWHRNKHRATQKYTTKVAQSFYDAFERNLENRNVFEKSMQHDWYWNLLFHSKYIDYGKEHSVKTDLYLAVVPYEYPIQFTGRQKIDTEITNYHSVQILFKSDEMVAHPSFIPSNTVNNSSPEIGFYMRVNAYFDLDVHYLFPMHTRVYFDVYSKDADGKETPMKRVEFTQYQQDTEVNKTTPAKKRSPWLVYEDDEPEEKVIYKTVDGRNYTYQEWKDFEEEQYKIYREKKTKKGFWDFLR